MLETAQIMFETLPQLILQGLLLSNILGDKNLTGVSNEEFTLSIVSAIVNSIAQICRLYLESRSVDESFVQYTLTCAQGRVGWLPFEHELIELINKNKYDNDLESNITVINYNIHYKIPLLSRIFGSLKVDMDFDFSSVTLRHLIATLSMLDDSTGNNNSNNGKDTTPQVSIIFGKSLRLLSVQDILLLLRVCKLKNVLLPDIHDVDVINWGHAIEISKEIGQDCRIIKHARNGHGKPLLSTFVDLPFDSQQKADMLQQLLKHDFDVNLQDTATGMLSFFLFFFFCSGKWFYL